MDVGISTSTGTRQVPGAGTGACGARKDVSHTFCSRQTKTMWATLLTHRHSSKGWSLANSKSQGVGKYTQRTDTLSDTEIQTSRHYYRMQVVVSPGDPTISLLGRFLFLSSSPPATRTLPTTPATINSQVEEKWYQVEEELYQVEEER